MRVVIPALCLPPKPPNGPTPIVVKVRTAYRSLAAAHHPDRHVGGDQEKAEVEFKRVSGGKERCATLWL